MVAPVFEGEKQTEVARRYEASESFYKIAKDYGCNYQAVKRAVEREGVEIRESPTARKLTDDQIEEAVRLYVEEGLSTGSVGWLFGVSSPVVRGYLLSRGIKLRKRGVWVEKHQWWKGGKHTDKRSGYVRIRLRLADPLYPHATNGSMQEHRYVMAKHLGRPLSKSETVHHINGVKHDNRIENLQLRQGKHASGVALVCGCCGSTDIREVSL